ncbi:MAG: hypothetical protein LBD78_03850 [Spirochaetaceae bacterium]|jgi:formate C-acetyltransferase|nr:hypothetical protein [Spirochaetaceae bacterium]
MNQNMISEPIRILYDHFEDNYDESLVRFRDDCYRAVLRENPNAPRCLQYAWGLSKYLSEKPVTVRTYDIFAGCIEYVNTSASNPLIMPERFHPRHPEGIFGDIVREINAYRELREDDLSSREDEALTYFYRSIRCGLGKRWPNGHVIPGFDFVLHQGCGALEERLREKHKWTQGARRDYFEAMLICVQAASSYMGRYEQAAGEALKIAETPEQRRTLRRIADACGRIGKEPPAHLFEAIQGFILLQEMILSENYSGSMSLGRVDQLLEPYYERDRTAGLIDFDQAGILIDALWLKLAGLVLGFQNVTVGGIDIRGNSAVNDITLLCLKASRKLRQDQPLLSLRVDKDMSDACWEEAQALIIQGGGFPALFNDDVVIQARERQGVDKSDSWNYGLVGCVEPSIGGKEYSSTEELRFNWAKILELMLNDGVCTVTGIDMGLAHHKNLKNIPDFETFYTWYKVEFTAALLACIQAANMLDTAYPLFFPSPLLSATYEGCVEKGEDASGRGPQYRFSTANTLGMADTVDSLAAIKQIVFEKKLVDLSTFAQALGCDFEGYGELQAYAQNNCPKYGNDIPEIDRYMKDLVNLFYTIVHSQKNSRGSYYQVGLYTVSDHSIIGKLTGALPDGRKKGVSLANAVAPVQGMDIKGPTAVINSALSFDHRQAANGLVLDLKFNPSFFNKESRRRMLRTLIETYFAQGGMEIQFNVVSRETLLEAQEDPQKYRNLVVRVSGFSAYFVMLDRTLQDEIIRRTEYHDI